MEIPLHTESLCYAGSCRRGWSSPGGTLCPGASRSQPLPPLWRRLQSPFQLCCRVACCQPALPRARRPKQKGFPLLPWETSVSGASLLGILPGLSEEPILVPGSDPLPSIGQLRPPNRSHTQPIVGAYTLSRLYGHKEMCCCLRRWHLCPPAHCLSPAAWAARSSWAQKGAALAHTDPEAG